jgi:hypothetical protein
MKIPLVASWLLLAGCTTPPAPPLVAAGRASLADSLHLQHLKYTFYRSPAGQLLEQRQWLIGESDPEPIIRYDSTLVLIHGDERTPLPLGRIVDVATYQEFDHSLFSKDKNRVYYSYYTSAGGFRVIVNGANPATFRASPDLSYGFDDKHGFYHEHALPGLNVRQQQLLYGDTAAPFIAYIKDKQRVFYHAKPILGADAPTFHVVWNQQWTAEDKNHHYD